MANIFYTEEHELFRSSLREFFKTEVNPHFEAWEKTGQIPHDTYKKMGEMGFFGLEVEEKYGGMQADYMFSAIFNEELGITGSAGFGTSIAAHAYLAMNYLINAGSPFIKEKYLLPSIKGELIGSLGMSEPFAGSDLKAIRTTAVLDRDHYIINGSKTFITNAYYGHYCVTAVKTDQGISMIVIDLDSEGVSKAKLDKIGLRCSDTAELAFDNVRVPKENLLGEEGKGFYYMMTSLQVERIAVAQQSIGLMQHALDITLQYVSERKAFGKQINQFQVHRHTIAEMASDLEAWRAFCDLTSYRIAQGEDVVKECSMLKLKTSDLLTDMVYKCQQMFGGYGFMEEYHIGRMYRDVRVIPIYAGTSEIMKEIIAKTIIDSQEYKSAYQK